MIQRLRSKGLIPAFIVTAVLAAAVAVPAISAGAHLFVNPAYCSGVTLSAAPPSGQPSGTQVVFTATGTCPDASPQFEFWANWAGTDGNWQLLQAYSTSAVYNWNSTGAAPGTENIGVWVKDANSPNTLDKNTSIPFVVQGPCGTLTATPAPTSINEGSGTHVTVTGSATCAHASPLYEFWLRTATSAWILAKAYTTTAAYDWNSMGSPFGTIYFGVWVKDSASGTATFDSNASTTVTVVQAKCTAVSLAAAPTAVTGGAHSTLTALASGCTNSTGQLYEFWLRTSTSAWIMVQAYGTAATYDWNSTGAPVGTITFGVWAKDSKSSTSTFDINNSTTVAVT